MRRCAAERGSALGRGCDARAATAESRGACPACSAVQAAALERCPDTHPSTSCLPCRYGFDASVPTGRGQRVVKAEIQPAPEKGKPADPADPWQPLESYPGNIVVVGSDYMLKGGDG